MSISVHSDTKHTHTNRPAAPNYSLEHHMWINPPQRIVPDCYSVCELELQREACDLHPRERHLTRAAQQAAFIPFFTRMKFTLLSNLLNTKYNTVFSETKFRVTI